MIHWIGSPRWVQLTRTGVTTGCPVNTQAKGPSFAIPVNICCARGAIWLARSACLACSIWMTRIWLLWLDISYRIWLKNLKHLQRKFSGETSVTEIHESWQLERKSQKRKSHRKKESQKERVAERETKKQLFRGRRHRSFSFMWQAKYYLVTLESHFS